MRQRLDWNSISWRKKLGALIGLPMMVVALLVVVPAASAHPAKSAATPIQAPARGGAAKVVKSGTVDLSKAPTLSQANNPAPTGVNPHPDRMSASARAAYNVQAVHATDAAHVTGAPALKDSKSPSFYGGGVLPIVSRTINGLTRATSGGWVPPDQAIGVTGSYVFEGVNNAIQLFSRTTGASIAGPFSTSTLFAPVIHGGDFLSDPQIFWDAMNDHWVIIEVELTPGSGSLINHGYINIAVNTTPTPLNTYHVVQYDANFFGGAHGNWCDFPTAGYDRWGIYITCIAFENTTNAFLGNTTLAIDKTRLYANTGNFAWAWLSVNNGLGSAAFRLSPSITDGTPDAEFFVATAAGYGTATNKLTVCAMTNTVTLFTNHSVAPTYTCTSNTTLPFNYNDPLPADQPGHPGSIDPGDGPKMVEYKAGKLYVAFSTVVFFTGDSANRTGAYWVDLTPQLQRQSAANPQIVDTAIVGNAYIYGFVGAYAYMPSLWSSTEQSEVLSFNYSSSATLPEIAYTARKATDPANTMGQGNPSGAASAVAGGGGVANTSGRWGDYSACALVTNAVSRGLIWCAGEITNADPNGWATFMYELRAE